MSDIGDVGGIGLTDGAVPDLDFMFHDLEQELLTSLLSQVHELLSVSGPVDGFATPDLDESDPVIHRLFPGAYPDDPVAAADFRRYTMDDQRRAKIAAIEVVLADLAAGDGNRTVIAAVHLDDWMQAINAVRLALAVRLGVADPAQADEVDDLNEGDPRFGLAQIYDWLGSLLGFLVYHELGIS